MSSTLPQLVEVRPTLSQRAYFFFYRWCDFLRRPRLAALPWWLHQLLGGSRKSLLYEVISPLGLRPRVHKTLYRLREVIDVPLEVAPRASFDAVFRAASVLAMVQAGRLDEAAGPVQRGAFGGHQKSFTPTQWQEIRDFAEEAQGCFEEETKLDQRRQERRNRASG